MAESPKQKHVIILGAGASVTSGYPDAKKLRLLLLSEAKVREELTRRGENPNGVDLLHVLPPMFQQDGGITNLFREGGFATVDEFSSLAQSRFPDEVNLLRWRLRWALALHNPEKQFENSDYYPFIQKLFKKQIFPLRDDIAILTFNYDPYLAFLLKRAAKVRYKAAGDKPIGDAEYALTSGFEGRNLGALQDGDGLCLLHLHGMIAWPTRHDHETSITFDDLFTDDTARRFVKLHYRGSPIPIIFPWEILEEDGRVRGKKNFCLKDQRDPEGCSLGGYIGNNDLHDLFVAIWKRAQREITHATKISFVGLSMHEFLTPAFRFLFEKKESPAQIAIANKDLESFSTIDVAMANSRSVVFKINQMLQGVWPAKGEHFSQGGNVAMHDTFEEFIRYEMD